MCPRLCVSRVPGAALLASAPHSLHRSVPHFFSGPGPSCLVDTREAQGAMSLSGGRKTSCTVTNYPWLPSPEQHPLTPFLAQGVHSRRFPQRKDRLATSAVLFTCPGPFWATGSGGRCLPGVLAEASGDKEETARGRVPWGKVWRRGGGPGGASLQRLGLPPACASRSQLLSRSCSPCPDSWTWGASAYGHPANLCSFPLLTLLSEITPRTAPLVMPAPARPVQRGRGRGHRVSI